MSMAVTEYINSTEELVNYLVEQLGGSTDWTTLKLRGPLSRATAESLPELSLPAVAVTHRESHYGEQPRRRAVLEALVCTDATDAEAEYTVRELTDAVIARIDGKVLNDACYKVRRTAALETDPGIAAQLVEIVVDDH